MAEIVISIVAKVAELLVVPVGKHICYPFKYKTNMDELKKQVEKLTAARDRVQHSIEEAERQRHEIESDVKNWLNSVDEFTEGVVKNIIGGDDDEDEENKAKKLCAIGFCPNPMTRYSLSKKAEKTAKVGVDLLKEGKFEKVSYCPAIRRTGSIYNKDYNAFDLRTPIFDEIMQILRDDNVNIIGVHGMGGVGKTTLVKRVVGKAIDDELFDVVVMVDVTQTPDIQKIQAQIADGLDLKFEVESLSGRAARLRDRLKKEKRVLLVLDDLWKKLDLKDVGIPFGEGGNAEQRQCKLLLTSRDLHVLRDHMNTQKDFQLKILTDEEAGNLFWQIVGDSAKTSDFHATGVEIIRHCAGLPVEIATFASALKNKSRFVWKIALDQLKKSNPRHIEGMEADVYSAIKWSYDFLQSEEEKSVFLLCSLYNASFNLDIDYLLQYCIGLGVFQGVSTIEQARNRLHTIIDKLKASHLLLDGNTNMCVKMHGIVHAVAILIASTDKLMFNIQDVTDLKETLEEKLPKNSTAMSVLFKDVTELPERLELPKLELLVLLMKKTSLQIPDPFFEGMEGLKVLHLNEVHMLSLPSSLCRLTSLQTLRLNQCLLGDIAVIGALKRIEILSFHSSSIEQLPRDLSQLTRLRLLDLRNCPNLKVISPNLISSLTQLEELYIGNSFIEWDVEGRSNASLAELKQLPCIKCLDICVLDARIIQQDLLIFEKLESYRIYIGDMWNRFGQLAPESFNKLRIIQVENCDTLNHLFSFSMVKNLSQLQEIEVTNCNKLEVIIFKDNEEQVHQNDRISRVEFTQLRTLTLQNLPQLTSFVFHSLTPNTESQEIVSEDQPRGFMSLFSQNVGFPSLEKMVISGMDNLESIWHNQFLGDSFYCPKLKSVEVNDCQKLKTIFPTCICGRLLSLESLTVKSCGLVEEIFDLQGRNLKEKHSIEITTQLRELYVDHMSNLRHIWNDDPKGMLSYRELRKITVFLCPNLENLFPASVAKSLLNLVSLDVSECGLLEEIIAKGGVKEAADRILFPRLSSLQLHNLPQLRTFYTGQAIEVSCLKRLGLHHCDKVKLFISEFLGFYKTIELEELQLSGKAITMEWPDRVPGPVFCSLKSLELNNHESTVLPLDFIQSFGRPEKLSLNSSSYKEIFSHGEVNERPQIKHLVLSGLFDLNQIWSEDSKIDLNFQKLEILEVRSCFNLNNLMPSSASFKNLMILEVWGCEGLKNLLTSSTAKSLVLLEKLEVFDCKMLIEVVANEGAVTEEINFRKLKSLSLVYLQSLASFCSMKHILNFPILESLVVNECPNMKIFSKGVTSTPELHKLELNWEAFEQSQEVDVNTTIKQNMEKR